MAPETARQAIDWVWDRYDRVGTVMFFGGEPTLNPSAIQACCERILDHHRRRPESPLPLLGMVTNGLALGRSMLDVIRRHDLVVTVSLDGPSQVNDRLRIARNGGGSYQRVVRTIRLLQRITAGREPSRIEVTYTSEHQKAGLTWLDLAAHVDREFGICDVHIAPVAIAEGHGLHWQPAAEDMGMIEEAVMDVVASWSTDRPRQMLSLAECLHPIVTHQCRPYLCGAGLSDLTILANGDVYPCYLLLADGFRLGNVAAAGRHGDLPLQGVMQRLGENTKARVGKCNQCWARHLCRACIGASWIENGTIDQIPDHVCAVNRAVAKAALLALSHIQADPAAWQSLVRGVRALMGANRVRHGLAPSPA
jgi:uncharacterized protein